MKNISRTYDKCLQEATDLADAVTDYAHFGEMAQALRAGRRALKAGELALEVGVLPNEVDKRLADGLRITALARELWVEARG